MPNLLGADRMAVGQFFLDEIWRKLMDLRQAASARYAGSGGSGCATPTKATKIAYA